MAARAPCLIALLTDFGTRDWYVASMKAVMLHLAPQARLVDITHEVPAYNVTAGAIALAAAVPWFPPRTIFVGVVDPGVGTARRLIAAKTGAHLFVGPDNGLLSLALEQSTRVSLVQLTNRRYWLPTVSRTFHGRDILAPVAAYLARGGRLSALGQRISCYTALPFPPVRRTAITARGSILYVDRFGNLITNLSSEVVRAYRPGRLRARDRSVRLVSSYDEGRPNEVVAVIGSSGRLELAVRQGSAARRWRLRVGDAIELTRADR